MVTGEFVLPVGIALQIIDSSTFLTVPSTLTYRSWVLSTINTAFTLSQESLSSLSKISEVAIYSDNCMKTPTVPAWENLSGLSVNIFNNRFYQLFLCTSCATFLVLDTFWHHLWSITEQLNKRKTLTCNP